MTKHDKIVQTFLNIPYDHVHMYNWGTYPPSLKDEWNVDEETYINGVLLTIDQDYEMGYLLEIVDRTSSKVTYIVVVRLAFGQYDSAEYRGNAGTFFDRTITHAGICVWGIHQIFELLETAHDRPQHWRAFDETR